MQCVQTIGRRRYPFLDLFQTCCQPGNLGLLSQNMGVCGWLLNIMLKQVTENLGDVKCQQLALLQNGDR